MPCDDFTTDAIEPRVYPGHEGYGVNSRGQIFTRRKRVSRGLGGGFDFIVGTAWKELAQSKRGRYLQVLMGRKQRLVHRLVLETFVGPQPPGMEACHNDGNPHNNRLDNLRWDTRKANHADQAHHGTKVRGERHPVAKLTEQLVRDIRTEFASGGVSHKGLASKYHVAPSLIHRVVARKSWAHVE